MERALGSFMLVLWVLAFVELGVWSSPMLTVIAWLGAGYLLWCVAIGPKRALLYLRRFRERAVCDAFSNALDRSLSQRYRVVALDDQLFSPRGASARPFKFAGGCLLAVLLVVTLIGPVAGVLAFAIPDLLMLLFVVVAGAWAAIAEILQIDIVNGLTALTFFTFFAAGTGAVLFFRNRTASRACIRSETQLDRLTHAVDRLGAFLRRSAVLAPTALVVTTTKPVWKSVVERLAARTSLTVIDVSVPSEALAWEVTALAPERTVLIADERSIRRWSRSEAAQDPKTPAGKINALLDAREVLCYSADRRALAEQFREKLLRRIDGIASSHRVPGPSLPDRFRRLRAAAGAWALVYAVLAMMALAATTVFFFGGIIRALGVI